VAQRLPRGQALEYTREKFNARAHLAPNGEAMLIIMRKKRAAR
jgi:hypothetical protein